MNILRKLIVSFILMACLVPKCLAQSAWVNDLRSTFLANKSIIYVVNIRTFNAIDKNKNGIIEEELGEQKGSFINAIDRLDELKSIGVNTIHVLPITPVGKTKALGTAGSLYSALSFNELNPQLKEKDSKLNLNNEARKFVNECHKRNIRVVVDLPSCASYDLYLKRPELFKKDKEQNPIVPCDWTDVRLLDSGTNSAINQDVYYLYKEFVDLMLDLNVDGIRADVATIKPYEFWKKLISETRRANPQFLFLAEASEAWNVAPSEHSVFTTYDKLLDAGFDGYYGSYFNLKKWKKSSELYSAVQSNIRTNSRFSEKKSAIASFCTHDEQSPILTNGTQFSRMVIWLSATLPVNSYYVDGFVTGDDYLYPLANKKASKSLTDDEYYFVHRGQLDIFNFSRKPKGKFEELRPEVILANKFKLMSANIVTNGTFVPLKTNSESVFAFARSLNKTSIIVIGNLNFLSSQSAKVSVPRLSSKNASIPIKIQSIPTVEKNKISTNLRPGEIMVMVFNELELK